MLTRIRLDVGLPSDLLLRRPDIRRQLASALEAKRSVLLDYVALHKSLGGGFAGT